MPYEIFLAIRYLRSRQKRRLVRATALAAVIGIALGVASLILALALSNGFHDEMRDKILQGTAHINVVRSDGFPISDLAALTAQIRQVEGVVSASATTYDGAVVEGPKGSSYAVLRGISAEAAESKSLQRWLQSGTLVDLASGNDEPKVIVGFELANRLGAQLGDVFQVIPSSSLNSVSVSTRRVRVAGIFRSGLFEYDSTWIYLPFDTVTTFAGENHAASVVSVQVNNTDDVKQISSRIKDQIGNNYQIIDWQQANQPLFAALALERRMGLFVIGLIIVIAVLNISTMLILVVVERRRDIAILSALGARKKGVMLLFVIEGACVGAIGAMVGTVLGLSACAIANHYKIVSLPPDVYSISNVPLNARLSETVFAAIAAFLLSVVATIYPARSAAAMRPVETLRDVT